MNILFCDIDETITLPSLDDRVLSPEEFRKSILDVKPNLEVINEVKRIAKQDGYDLVFDTGRSEEIRLETVAWLKNYFTDPVVLMRPISIQDEAVEQIYNSKVKNAKNYMQGEDVQNILFIDNNKEQLIRYLQAFPYAGAYWVNKGTLDKSFHFSPKVNEPKVDLEELEIEETDTPEIEGIYLASINDIFDD